MTPSSAPTVAAAPLPMGSGGRREVAFKAANRHSARVRRLRWLTLGAVGLFVLGVPVVTLFNPFGKTLPDVTIAGAAVEGTKVTMTLPKLSGHQKDGRPYAIEADRAVQDLKQPGLVDLFVLKARLVMADKSVTHLTAATGNYNSVADVIVLTGGAHVMGENGLDVVARDATVEFKKDLMYTDKPVTVAMPGKRIAADSLRIVDGGRQVTFAGHVHTDISPDEATAVATAVVPAP